MKRLKYLSYCSGLSYQKIALIITGLRVMAGPLVGLVGLVGTSQPTAKGAGRS